jgi:imidazolonepropionase-like amidohydrolase
MKHLGAYLSGGLLTLAGLGLLALTNTGLLSFRAPFVREFSARLAQPAPVFVFENVNVIAMDAERVLTDQTVVVREGRIAEVGPRGAVTAPEGAPVIDGVGRYLMPGLADMHVHVQDENELLLFVAAGVTTVRNLWGNTGLNLALGLPDQLQLRAEIAAGKLLGPTLLTSGPIMEGEPPASPLLPVFRTPEEAARSVAWQKAQGYDFVKVYDNLTPEVYAAILQAAREHGLPVVGHAPRQVGLAGVLAGGQVTIEHLTGYVDPDTAQRLIPEDELDAAAERTRVAGVWNCATLVVYPRLIPGDRLEELERQTGMEYISPRQRLTWRFFVAQMQPPPLPPGEVYADRITALHSRGLRALRDAGARILLGTDTDNPYLVPGFSAHEELALLVAAGYTPYEALQAGTRHAAEALGQLDEFGTLAAGQRADVILLARNPLEDVAHAREIEGVMVRGRWLPRADLDAMLAGLAASHTPTLPDRLWPLALIAGGLSLLRPQPRRSA